MARRTRSRRPLGVAALTAWPRGPPLISVPAQAEPAAAAASVTVRPDPSYQQEAFEGRGTSLVWFANATGDHPPEIREKLARLLFGDDGLGLNIARYNIGGGNAPDVKTPCAPAARSRAGGGRRGTTREDTDWWSADDPADWNEDADATSAGGSSASRTTSTTGRRSATPRPGS